MCWKKAGSMTTDYSSDFDKTAGSAVGYSPAADMCWKKAGSITTDYSSDFDKTAGSAVGYSSAADLTGSVVGCLSDFDKTAGSAVGYSSAAGCWRENCPACYFDFVRASF
jgi:hypothetical protein